MSGIDISSNLRIVQACLDNRQWNLSLFIEFCRNLNIGGAMSRNFKGATLELEITV